VAGKPARVPYFLFVEESRGAPPVFATNAP